jgi:hypothetical protein
MTGAGFQPRTINTLKHLDAPIAFDADAGGCEYGEPGEALTAVSRLRS